MLGQLLLDTSSISGTGSDLTPCMGTSNAPCWSHDSGQHAQEVQLRQHLLDMPNRACH